MKHILCGYCGNGYEDIDQHEQECLSRRDCVPSVPAAPQPQAKRQPVDFRYDALNWDFVKLLAQIAYYAAGKYGAAEQYTESRLTGDQGPVNHIYEHLRQYQAGEPHDHFTDSRYHLAAIAYNAMMEAWYLDNYGHKPSPLLRKPPTGEK